MDTHRRVDARASEVDEMTKNVVAEYQNPVTGLDARSHNKVLAQSPFERNRAAPFQMQQSLCRHSNPPPPITMAGCYGAAP